MAEQVVGVVVCVCVFWGGGRWGLFSHCTLFMRIMHFNLFWQTEVMLCITCHAIPILALLTPT